MTQKVFETKLCGAAHPSEPATCGRPLDHLGPHQSSDHRLTWGGVEPPRCNTRHPTGKTCGRELAHPGPHTTADHLLTWTNQFRPGGR